MTARSNGLMGPMRRSPRSPGLTSTLAALALAGCAAVGPDYRPPTASAPAAFAGASGAAALASSSDAELKEWWRGFHDPTLDDLIDRALAGNLDVKTAVSRIRQARARERIAGAAAMPTLNASGQA